MTPDEWKMIMLLEIDDFVSWWNRRILSAGYTKLKSFNEWLEIFMSFQEDRQ